MSVLQLIINMAKEIQKYRRAYEMEKKKREELETMLLHGIHNRLLGDNLYG